MGCECSKNEEYNDIDINKQQQLQSLDKYKNYKVVNITEYEDQVNLNDVNFLLQLQKAGKQVYVQLFCYADMDRKFNIQYRTLEQIEDQKLQEFRRSESFPRENINLEHVTTHCQREWQGKKYHQNRRNLQNFKFQIIEQFCN